MNGGKNRILRSECGQPDDGIQAQTRCDPSTSADLKIMREPGRTDQETMALSTILPHVRHAFGVGQWAGRMFPEGQPGLTESVAIVTEQCDRVRGGDLSGQTDLLVAQAMTLDAIFTENARRASMNIGEFPHAVEMYMRMAMKAQAQSRATIEALAKIVQPREQTVRHVHVGPDGKAVFIENYNGGVGSARYDGRAHAATDAAVLGDGATLPRPDPLGEPVPIASGEREDAVPDARRGGR